MDDIIPKEARFDAEGQQNLEGTLKLFYNRVKVLFDTGVLNSFISFKLVQDLGLVPQTLNGALNAMSPLGAIVKFSRVCQDCPITLDDRNFPIDLIVLSMKEFDVILGIDWLTKFHANLDLMSRSIAFLVPGSFPFKFSCNPFSDGFFISCLATIETARSKISVYQIPVV